MDKNSNNNSSNTTTSTNYHLSHSHLPQYHHSPRTNLNLHRGLLSTSNAALNQLTSSNNSNSNSNNKSKSNPSSDQQQKKKNKKMDGSYSDDDMSMLARAVHDIDSNFQFDYTHGSDISVLSSSPTASNSSQSEDIELMVRSTSLRKKNYTYGNLNGSVNIGSNNIGVRPSIGIEEQHSIYNNIQQKDISLPINTNVTDGSQINEPSSLKSNSSASSTSSSSTSSPNDTPPISSLPPNNNTNFDSITPNRVNTILNNNTNNNNNINNNDNNNNTLHYNTTTTNPTSNTPPIFEKRNNKAMVGGVEIDRSTPVNFNVGGSVFATSLNSLLKCKNSVLFKIVEMQIQVVFQDDTIFIDRNPNYFSCILDFLRTGRYVPPIGINTKGLLMEAEFFGIEDLAAQIRDEPEITRIDIINLINSCYDYPRFRGLWLTKLNFSGLDLSCALFEFANISKSTFRSTNIQQANFVGANMNEIYFDSNYGIGVKFSNAKVANAAFTNNVLYESTCYNAKFTGSDLRGTKFACSDLSGASFINCKLQGCDFSHCDLTEVNFSGSVFDKTSNLSCSTIKDTNFEGTNHEVAIKKKSWKKPKAIRNRSKVLSTIPGMG